jgi:hypothetical protein
MWWFGSRQYLSKFAYYVQFWGGMLDYLNFIIILSWQNSPGLIFN